MSNLPKIIKTVFYVDPNHGRNYTFDVNQNISISEIKGMLVVASKVARIGLRIFHKQTEKEYTGYKSETLEELFPGKELVEFIIQIDRRYRNQQDYDQLKLGQHCQFHPHKYCFYYCFDCEMSLCSLCLGSGKHVDHSVFEKFDYLKPSNEIVDNIFADIDAIANQADSLNKQDVEDFRLKLHSNYFPTLIELLKRIEEKMNKQIDEFNHHYQFNIKAVKTNSVNLKDHCTEGLDELKDQIDIENMLKDEGVFLHFDYKVKELSQQKQRIYEDSAKIDKIIKSFGYAKARLDQQYHEIKEFLTKQLSSTIYEDIRSKTTEVSVLELNKESVLNKLLSEFKKKHGKIVSEAKPPLPGSNAISNAINSAVFRLDQNLSAAKTQMTANPNPPQSVNQSQLFDNITNDRKSEVSKSQSSVKKSQQPQSNSALDKSLISDHNQLTYKKDNEKTVYIMKVYEGDNRLVIFQEKEGSESDMHDRQISFKQSTHGIDHFLKNCAILNTKKVIYISGGDLSLGTPSNIFLCYNPAAHTLLRLEDLPQPKSHHSMILFGEFIYSVGGMGTNTCERYDIKLAKWTKMHSLKSEERQRPILHIHQNWLYAFFGYQQGGYLNTIERISLKSTKSKWEQVIFSNPGNINLGMYGAGVMPVPGGLYLVGGKTKEKTLSSVYQYDFEKNTISECEFGLDSEAYFKESSFLELEDGDQVLYNENEDQLLKLNLAG